MKRIRGFTLVEVLVAMAIMATLAGIVLAAMAPARERARITVCTSNLHQIGIAYSLYAADYDGIEATKGVRSHYYELGLPSDESDVYFSNTYIKNKQVWVCPSFHGAYSLNGSRSTYTGFAKDGEGFADQVAKRGADVPLWSCEWHNPGSDPITDFTKSAAWVTKKINILRLSGQVNFVTLPARNHDAWDW